MLTFDKTSRFTLPLLLAVALLAALPACSKNGDPIVLEKGDLRIVFSDTEPGALKIALEAFRKDFVSVMGSEPVIVNEMDADTSTPEIVIVNRASGGLTVPPDHARELDGFESHRIYADVENNRIYLEGNDHRGTIYAMYTFSDKFLGVPPLYHWTSWVPVRKDRVSIPADTDVFFKSPQVRYRTLLPGDQDFFNPWKAASEDHQNIWLETTLRLKLNTVEGYTTIVPGYGMSDYARLIASYGLVLTSHHTSGLNTSFRTWGDYWRDVRGMEPPPYRLSNKQAILEFFRHNAETVRDSGIENLWTVAFRGERDQPYWSIFEDAPDNDEDRALVINEMLQIQLDLIREMTGEQEPYARITFYDEIADLMSKGYLKPPAGENMIWTYVAARRDPYPYDDLVAFDTTEPVKLGFYMNFGFASTGPHVAPAESPWKMEFNYRYINDKSPLYFTVVNVGNMREFLLELSAHAEMMWDYDSYDSDRFVERYSATYFGEEHAAAIAQLYKDFYGAYWQPKPTEFEGMERQFLFQDLRYARAFDHVLDKPFFQDGPPNLNPLREIGYERMPGRTFRLDFEHNNAENQVDAILNGMQQTIPRFEAVAERATEMMALLDDDKKTFFNDNLRVFSYYMTHLSKTLYHFMYAYKHQADRDVLIENLDLAYNEAVRAEQYLHEAQHGVFSTWYEDAEDMDRTFQIDALQKSLLRLKQEAQEQLESAVYAWDELDVEKRETGERRHVFKGSTEGFEYLQVHASTVEPGTAVHAAHTHDDREELIIVKEGTIRFSLNGESKVLPTGSVALALPGDSHGIQNAGDVPATYYIIRWRTKESDGAADPQASSQSVSWDDLEVKEISKGERRSIMRVPTAMLAEFEIHTTMLNEGMKSHDQHIHAEDEIIIVRYGQVEEMIGGVPHEAGPGAVIFLQADQPHGIRNIGEGPCEYYAFKWKLR
jgi:quercetin dioxygenase-like cupin family protein